MNTHIKVDNGYDTQETLPIEIRSDIGSDNEEPGQYRAIGQRPIDSNEWMHSNQYQEQPSIKNYNTVGSRFAAGGQKRPIHQALPVSQAPSFEE